MVVGTAFAGTAPFVMSMIETAKDANVPTNTARGFLGRVAKDVFIAYLSGARNSSLYQSFSGLIIVQQVGIRGDWLFRGPHQLFLVEQCLNSFRCRGFQFCAATRSYARGTTPIADRSNESGSTVLTWLLSDQQDTVTSQIVDSSEVLSVMRQDPFGKARTGSAGAWGDRHGFRLRAPMRVGIWSRAPSREGGKTVRTPSRLRAPWGPISSPVRCAI